MQKFAKTRVAAMAMALAGAGLLAGCSGGPGGVELEPTGHIQGSFVDATTGEPIKGVKIDIGIASATTNSNGVFVIKDVPATQGVDINNGSNLAGTYSAVVSFEDVNDDLEGAKYPPSMTTTFAVQFTSLEDSSFGELDPNNNGGGEQGTVGSLNDTPVTGIAIGTAMTVGKMSTSLTGKVLVKETNAEVAEAYTVQLWEDGDGNTGNGFTSAGAILRQSLTTAEVAASGDTAAVTFADVSFSGVQAGTVHRVIAFNADNSMTGQVDYTAPGDNQAASLAVGGTAQPILVIDSDTAAPYVYSVAINDGTTDFEDGADIGSATSATVTFNFSEAMKADGYTTGVVPTTATELYDDVYVDSDGNKAGDIAHSMAWNDAMTALTVTIPNLASSSLYEVHLVSGNMLMDDNDQALDMANSQAYETGNTDTLDGTRGAGPFNEIVVNFSTGGGTEVAAPTVTITNSSTLDTGSAPVLDWSWQTGASSYNVYRTTKTAGVTTDAMKLVSNVTVSGYTSGALAFVDGELAQSYDFVVKAVNSDGTEGTASTAVSAADVIGPADPQTTGGGGLYGCGITAADEVTIAFAEPLNEAAAETTTAYTLGGADAALTVSSATYNPTADGNGNYQVVLGLSANCTVGATVATQVGVTDVAGNKLNATPANTAGTAAAASAY
jgi:hypothetical protein